MRAWSCTEARATDDPAPGASAQRRMVADRAPTEAGCRRHVAAFSLRRVITLVQGSWDRLCYALFQPRRVKSPKLDHANCAGSRRGFGSHVGFCHLRVCFWLRSPCSPAASATSDLLCLPKSGVKTVWNCTLRAGRAVSCLGNCTLLVGFRVL